MNTENSHQLLTRNNKMKFIVSIIFFILYYIVFGSTSFLSGFIHHRMMFVFPFENRIPFYPAWSIVYLSINFYLLSALWVLPYWERFAALAMTLIIETLIAGVFFIILPMKLIYLPNATSSAFSNFVYVAKFFSLSNNYFPSLHTAFAFTLAFVFNQYCSKRVTTIFFIWACAISLSTLLIHEHQVIDLFAGFMLAWISYQYIFKKMTNLPLPLSSRYIDTSLLSESTDQISNQ